MKKLNKTALRWWGAIVIATSMVSPVFGQISEYPFTESLRPSSYLTVFQDNLYLIVYTGPRDGYQLCKFDGVNFTLFPQTEAGYNVVAQYSPLVVYNDGLYMISTQYMDSPLLPPPPTLMRFDGTSFTSISIPFGRVPSELAQSNMQVFNGKLYVDVVEEEINRFTTAFVAYDGTDFELINFPPGMVSTRASAMTVYHDKLFRFLKNGMDGAPQLVSFDGTTFETYAIPNVVETKMTVYNDNLILTQTAGGRRQLLAFDGTTATVIPTPGFAAGNSAGTILDGALYLRMANIATPTVFDKLVVHDGTGFRHVATVRELGSNFETWRDQVWFTGRNATWPNVLFSYKPVPSDDGVGHPIYDFERIDFDLNSMGRGWCWNEIIIDWDINPICLTPPLCPEEGDPVWLSLLDKDKTIWEAALKDQSQLIIPVADNPYTLSLATEKSKLRQEFLTIDNNLVGMGLERIKLGLKPLEGNLNILLATKKDKTVPVTLSLLNDKGEAVWQEDVVAPAEKQLTIQSKEPGAKFVISAAGATLESAGITAATYYPNPFDGKITIDLETKGDKVPVQVTIDDPNGKRVVDAALTAPVKQTLELKEKKQGFYVLTFTAGGASRQAKIELK